MVVLLPTFKKLWERKKSNVIYTYLHWKNYTIVKNEMQQVQKFFFLCARKATQ